MVWFKHCSQPSEPLLYINTIKLMQLEISAFETFFIAKLE